ncbi:MAG: UDP-N-acetylmuramoyl-L-alanyl-D-glutamate--2,6-diaminopimelate ligase [Micropruina sp.]|nr:UDP-N-acetylmuramoyl-L-alanyl-D-glutamate--2,6-diaminopimelate ligase [Micropruina sp.]
MPLADLVASDSTAVVSGVCLDSRTVRPGDLYVGLAGAVTHGAKFATSAVARGAVAVLTDPDGAVGLADLGVPVVAVEDPRAAMAGIAAQVYGHPARRLAMFGITGTNGKTSTLFLLEAGLRAVGEVVGTIGTIGFRVAGTALPSARTTVTTPESPDLQALLAVMVDAGATAVGMEVSSHALALRRVDGVEFAVAGFTQLGQDHLDFHRDQASYFEAKSRLFLGGRTRVAVVYTDDPWGRLAELIAADGHARLITTGSDSSADYWVRDYRTDEEGRSRVVMATPSGDVDFTVGMIGSFNVRNAVTAAAMIEAAGYDLGQAVRGFAEASVPGRMQRVDLGADAPRVVVDFAHTPEAISACLAALPEGRRIAVFGCGGDRDPIKRRPMGQAAARGAELVIVTDDNPRSELPATIRAAALAGAESAAQESGAEVLDGGERRSAIRLALARGDASTWIAILGKGHEWGQEANGVITPFDDVDVARTEWAELTRRRAADA